MNGKELQFGLQVDEISIKRSIEWDGKMFHGTVNLGLDNDNDGNSEEATYALVFMLVCLNGHLKTPISYYFIRSLSAETRANILKQNLIFLYENGISNIRSLTFDGAVTNISMAEKLGAKMWNIEEDSFFYHPITKELIVIILDACYMLKLVKNTMANNKSVLKDKEAFFLE